MNGGLVRLREVFDELNPSERKVAAYILQSPADMVHQSVAQLAESSGASQAAIIRLCKTMGLKGYQDLKLKVAGDLQQSEPLDGYQDIRPDDTVQSMIQNVSSNNIQSIRDTIKVIDPISAERAIMAVGRAKRIYFYGVGASNLIAMDAQQKFLRIGMTCFSFADPHVQLTTAVTLTADDVAVCISYSGETSEVLRIAKLAKDRGCPVISITKYGDNALTRIADVPLHTSATEHEIRSGAMASRIAQLNVVDILYVGVASRTYDRSVSYLDQSRQAIRKH